MYLTTFTHLQVGKCGEVLKLVNSPCYTSYFFEGQRADYKAVFIHACMHACMHQLTLYVLKLWNLKTGNTNVIGHNNYGNLQLANNFFYTYKACIGTYILNNIKYFYNCYCNIVLYNTVIVVAQFPWLYYAVNLMSCAWHTFHNTQSIGVERCYRLLGQNIAFFGQSYLQSIHYNNIYLATLSHLFLLPQTWSSTVLIVSYDRTFLTNICTDIIHMHSGMQSIPCNYRPS